jgi:hypothetical protein
MLFMFHIPRTPQTPSTKEHTVNDKINELVKLVFLKLQKIAERFRGQFRRRHQLQQ